jgi:hypothetical protein
MLRIILGLLSIACLTTTRQSAAECLAARTTSRDCNCLTDLNRDKTGTSGSVANNVGSQMAAVTPLASRVSFVAEGRGLEPPTGFPAPDFESGR